MEPTALRPIGDPSIIVAREMGLTHVMWRSAINSLSDWDLSHLSFASSFAKVKAGSARSIPRPISKCKHGLHYLTIKNFKIMTIKCWTLLRAGTKLALA